MEVIDKVKRQIQDNIGDRHYEFLVKQSIHLIKYHDTDRYLDTEGDDHPSMNEMEMDLYELVDDTILELMDAPGIDLEDEYIDCDADDPCMVWEALARRIDTVITGSRVNKNIWGWTAEDIVRIMLPLEVRL